MLGDRFSYSYYSFNRRSDKPGSSYLTSKRRQAYCANCSRETFISKPIHFIIYGGRPSLVWRNALFPYVITVGDVIDSTLMHINDLPRLNSTLTQHQRSLILLKHDPDYHDYHDQSLDEQGHPTSLFRKYLFGRRCEI